MLTVVCYVPAKCQWWRHRCNYKLSQRIIAFRVEKVDARRRKTNTFFSFYS